jgi:hypothetical protein
MKTFCLIGIVLLLAGASAAQKIGKKESSPASVNGVMYGSIFFRDVSAANFRMPRCKDFTIMVGSSQALWTRWDYPSGTLASGRCEYKISNIPLQEKFSVIVAYPFYKTTCDAEVLKYDAKPPITVFNYGQQLKHDVVITEFRCDVNP